MGRIEKARIAGKINREAIEHGFSIVEPGMTLLELDAALEKFILGNGCTPAFKGYRGFPGASCLSINNVAVHGVPNNYKIQFNDVLTIDIGTIYEGIYADSAKTDIIGDIVIAPGKHATNLIVHTECMLEQQISMLRPGVSLLDIATINDRYREIYEINLVEQLGGHYIGESLHMDPFVPNTLDFKKGSLNVDIQKKKYAAHLLKAGDILCLEPVATFGPTNLTIDPDGWTCRTPELSAHCEHTVLITETGYEILT